MESREKQKKYKGHFREGVGATRGVFGPSRPRGTRENKKSIKGISGRG